MHKQTYRATEDEYLEDRYSQSLKQKRRVGRDRGDPDQHQSSDRNSQWVYGNLFECLSGNEHCMYGRIPFGGSFYCAWPLKETSVCVHRKPPCLWDAE